MTIEEHILHLMQTASQEIDRKYRDGQKQHGGLLWEKFSNLEFLKHLRDEIIDSFVYVQCAIDQIEKQENLQEMLAEMDRKAEKICTVGQS